MGEKVPINTIHVNILLCPVNHKKFQKYFEILFSSFYRFIGFFSHLICNCHVANWNDKVQEKSANHTQIYLEIGWKNSARLKVLKHKKRIKGWRCQIASFFFICCHLHFTWTEMPKCAGKTRQAKMPSGAYGSRIRQL